MGVTDTSQEKLQKAISLIKAGNKKDGGNILANLLTIQPDLEMAWLWLHICAETDEHKIYCLNRALQLNPNRIETRQTLDKLIQAQPLVTVTTGPVNSTRSEPVELNTSKTNSLKTHVRKNHKSNDIIKKLPKGPILIKDNEIQGRIGTNRKDNKSTTRNAAKQAGKPVKKQKPKKRTKNDVDQTTEQKTDIVRFQPPKIIVVRPSDNLFADDNWKRYNFSKFDTTMLGGTLFIDGLRISVYDLPRCMEVGRIPPPKICYRCEFFSIIDCPIRDDTYLLNDARLFITARQQRYIEHEKRKNANLKAIYHELSSHGRPLHYSVLAKIVRKRHPTLGLTEGGVMRRLAFHPELFDNLGDGVYQCKKRRKRQFIRGT